MICAWCILTVLPNYVMECTNDGIRKKIVKLIPHILLYFICFICFTLIFRSISIKIFEKSNIAILFGPLCILSVLSLLIEPEHDERTIDKLQSVKIKLFRGQY